MPGWGSSGGQAAGSHFQPITRQNGLTAPGLREAPPEALEPKHHSSSSIIGTFNPRSPAFLFPLLLPSFPPVGYFLFEFISSLLADNMIGHGATGVLGEGQFDFQPRKSDQVQDSTNANCRWNSR